MDVDGEVVGLNDADIPPAAGAVALGFAIPSATVVDVVEQLLNTGRVRSPFVGVRPGRITQQVAERLGLPRTDGCWCSTWSATARPPRACNPATSSPR